MNKRYLLALLIILYGAMLFAQSKQYSYKKAIAASLLFPGGGELYTKKYKTAGVLIASEIMVFWGYNRMKAQQKWEENTYKQYAYSIADVPLGSSKDKYSLISQWQSVEEYNNNVKLNARNFYNDDPEAYQEFLDRYLIPESEGWDWHTKSNFYNYRKYRENTQNFKIYANLIASGFVLNRLISVLDSVITIKKLKRLKITAVPDLNKKGIRIKYVYKF